MHLLLFWREFRHLVGERNAFGQLLGILLFDFGTQSDAEEVAVAEVHDRPVVFVVNVDDDGLHGILTFSNT